MTPGDIRVGNIVGYDVPDITSVVDSRISDTNLVVIKQICPPFVQAQHPRRHKHMKVRIKNLYGIQVRGNMLSRLGFVRGDDGRWTYYNIDGSPHVKIRIDAQGNALCGYQLKNQLVFICKCEYFHQIQNVVRDVFKINIEEVLVKSK